MSTALGGVSTSLRWINQPCRTAGSIKGENCYGDEFVDSMASTRVHRWLAYKSFQMLTGEYARPQIQWFINGRGLGSYSLPQVTVPSFFDLESTPVKPGMWFKLSGVEFGIQTPQSGSSYA
jgi:hypothetical protein